MSFLKNLKRDLDTRHTGPTELVKVKRADLQELLYHFDRLDQEVRERHKQDETTVPYVHRGREIRIDKQFLEYHGSIVGGLLDATYQIAIGREKITKGTELVAAERKRQIEQEGWTPAHDRQWGNSELAIAAACYALPGVFRYADQNFIPKFWPWERTWWKPTPDDRVRELTKSAALTIAEIDRLLAKTDGKKLDCLVFDELHDQDGK